jgi:hypothetical protein
MKRLNHLSIVLVFCSTFIFNGVHAQATKTPAKKTETKNATSDQTFLDRYYEIRDTYPNLFDCYGNYAASWYSLPKFMERYNQIKAAYPQLTDAFGNYAGSEYSLDEFAKRYYAIKDT